MWTSATVRLDGINVDIGYCQAGRDQCGHQHGFDMDSLDMGMINVDKNMENTGLKADLLDIME